MQKLGARRLLSQLKPVTNRSNRVNFTVPTWTKISHANEFRATINQKKNWDTSTMLYKGDPIAFQKENRSQVLSQVTSLTKKKCDKMQWIFINHWSYVISYVSNEKLNYDNIGAHSPTILVPLLLTFTLGSILE